MNDAKNTGVKKGLVNGLGMGTLYFLIFSAYALAFWYGTQLMIGEGYSAGDLMTVGMEKKMFWLNKYFNFIQVFFCVLIGAFAVGNAAPNLQDFANSRGAAYAIYHIIDSVNTPFPSRPHLRIAYI